MCMGPDVLRELCIDSVECIEIRLGELADLVVVGGTGEACAFAEGRGGCCGRVRLEQREKRGTYVIGAWR